MKNIVKLFSMFMIMVGTFAFGQQKYVNYNADVLKKEVSKAKKKLFCITYSCCGVGPFGIEIWSHKECHYITTSKKHVTVIGVKNQNQTEYTKDYIEIKNDIVLVDKDKNFENRGKELIMKSGLYKVIKGEIIFEPTERISSETYCYEREVKGQILGHDYSYVISICIKIPSSNKVNNLNGGYAVLDLNTSQELVDLVYKNKSVLSLNQDLLVGDKYIIKAGDYNVENGKIYTRKIQLK